MLALTYKGQNIIPNELGKYEINGAITDGDLIATVPAYASGTYGFKLSASSIDGEIAHTQDAAGINDIPFNFVVKPDAQTPDVASSISLEVAQNGVNENSSTFTVSLAAELLDTDGSEEISYISLFIADMNSENSSLSSSPVFTLNDVQGSLGTVNLSQEFIGEPHTLILPGNNETEPSETISGYQVMVPKSVIDDAGTAPYQLNVDVTMPQYFDGQIQIISTAMSMERLEATEKEVGYSRLANAEKTVVDIKPVADGFVDEGFSTSGTSTLAGNPILLSDLINNIQILDPDETINLRIFGLPTGTEFNGPSVVQSGDDYLINSVTLEELNLYSFKTGIEQGDFSFQIAASTQDDLVVSTEQIRNINIASTALLEPEFYDSDGNKLGRDVFDEEGNLVQKGSGLSFSASEGGAGTLDISVALGSQMNPRNVDVTISNLPDGYVIQTKSGELIVESADGFTLSGNKLAQGLIIQAGENATEEQKNFVGTQNVNIDASVNYFVDGENITLNSSMPANLSVIPVTDGITFSSTLQVNEDSTIFVEDLQNPELTLARLIDPSEVVDEITIQVNDDLNVSYPGSDGFVSLQAGPITISDAEGLDLSSIQLRPDLNFNGTSNLEISMRSKAVIETDEGLVDGDIITQSKIIPITINPVIDELVMGIGGELNAASVSSGELLHLFNAESPDSLLQKQS